ncbi:hypothetical protein EVA_20372 [gut metagenome]|uniref:Uncharacterized protein n=1 Tax=gut metagenome TaxID=749906 RepID=J9BVF0_9ZZZZ
MERSHTRHRSQIGTNQFAQSSRSCSVKDTYTCLF